MSDTPLRIVIGFSAGSASDDIANLIAAPLGTALGRSVAIERIAGDNGAHAAQAVARAAPNGNTLLVATLGTHALAPHVRKDLPYHPQRDFAPVSLLTRAPMLLACCPGLPVHDVPSLIEHARAHPGEITYGTSAIGGAPHLAAELFQMVTGVQLRHVRYDETNDLYVDLESCLIDLSFNNIMSMLPRCNAGSLRALGLTGAQRSPVAPHIATLAEGGVQGCDVSNWVGLVAPRATPVAMVDAISQAVTTVINSRDIAGNLITAGISPMGWSPAAFEGFMAAELTRWGPVVARFAAAN